MLLLLLLVAGVMHVRLVATCSVSATSMRCGTPIASGCRGCGKGSQARALGPPPSPIGIQLMGHDGHSLVIDDAVQVARAVCHDLCRTSEGQVECEQFIMLIKCLGAIVCV